MAQMDYKGTGNIQSFRGLLVDGGQDRIRIQGSVGAVAWRITKFQLMNKEAGASANEMESTVKIYREEQSSVDAVVNFDDAELLGAAQLGTHANLGAYPQSTVIIFDNSLFSRNIYVTHKNLHADALECNYYIELEEVKVSKAGMAQLAVAAARRDPSLA